MSAFYTRAAGLREVTSPAQVSRGGQSASCLSAARRAFTLLCCTNSHLAVGPSPAPGSHLGLFSIGKLLGEVSLFCSLDPSHWL